MDAAAEAGEPPPKFEDEEGEGGAHFYSANPGSCAMLKVLLGALKEPVGGIDTACVRLLQRVMPHTLRLADGLPPLVVCIQGVNDKDTRHTYAHLIEEAGGEWREPNFAAERVSGAERFHQCTQSHQPQRKPPTLSANTVEEDSVVVSDLPYQTSPTHHTPSPPSPFPPSSPRWRIYWPMT